MISLIDDNWKLEIIVAGCPEFDTTDGDPKITRGMKDLFENTDLKMI
jgi:hypothetical protein